MNSDGGDGDGGDGGGFARLKSEELPPGFAAKLIVAEKGPLEDFMNKLVGPF